MYLSDWLRRTSLESHEVRALLPPAEDEPQALTMARSQFAMFDLKLRTARESMPEDKRERFDDLMVSMRGLLGMVIEIIERH